MTADFEINYETGRDVRFSEEKKRTRPRPSQHLSCGSLAIVSGFHLLISQRTPSQVLRDSEIRLWNTITCSKICTGAQNK